MTQRYPLPVADLTLANPNAAKPRYSGPGVAGDWAAGAVGNDVNVATATVALARSGSANTDPAYTPTTQTAKGQAMVPSRVILDDLGIDYGPYAGGANRTGTITPKTPYPAVNQ
jgi:hypothetical protein